MLRKFLFPVLVCLFQIANTSAASVPARQGLPAGQGGFVYVGLPGQSAYVTVTVKSLSDGSTYTLDTIFSGDEGSAGSWIPPGDYKIAKWDTYDYPDYTAFHVDPKRVTDLGNLIPIQIGGYQFVVVPVRLKELASGVDTVIAKYRPLLETAVALEWNPINPPRPMDIPQPAFNSSLGAFVELLSEYSQHLNKPPLRQQLLNSGSNQAFFESARASSAPLTQMAAQDEGGNMYYGADWGQVRVRTPDGSWSSLDTGTIHQVTALTRQGSRLVAGYDNGQIRLSTDGGKSWTLVKTLDSGDAVIDLSWTGSTWLAVTADLQDSVIAKSGSKQIVVYISPDQALDQFSRLKVMVPVGAAFTHAQLADHDFFVSVDNTLMKLDLRTMAWSNMTLPVVMTGFGITKPGNTIVVYKAKGIFSKLYVSTDLGTTWSSRNAPQLVIRDIKFTSADNGIEVRMRPNFLTTSTMLMRYEAVNDRWVPESDLPKACERMIDDANAMPRFCVTKNGAILSQNQGKWSIEYASE